MVNYGYGPDSKNWNEHKKFELASKLENLLGTMMKEGKMKSMNHVCMPYVEVDELYIGVRIRKITRSGRRTSPSFRLNLYRCNDF